jgi:hypothetical protein
MPSDRHTPEESASSTHPVARTAVVAAAGTPGRDALVAKSRPEGGSTDAFEIICCDYGYQSEPDYSEVPPELRRVRWPYPIADGIAAYMKHVGLHHQPAHATSTGPGRMLADRR